MKNHLQLLSILLMALFIGSCGRDAPATQKDDHGSAAGHHDHGPGSVIITHFTPQSEVFVEFPPFAARARSPFALHLTELPSGKAITDAKVTVRMRGTGGELRFEAGMSKSPGIYRPAPIPTAAGQYDLFIDIQRPGGTITHDLGKQTVHATTADADKALAAAGPAPEGISFTKEIQWRVDFSTETAMTAPVLSGLPARVHVRGAADGEAVLAAPVSGRVEAIGAFIHVGQRVGAGQPLLRVRPLGSEAAEAAGIAVERARAAADLDAARTDLARAEQLLAKGFVARQRVEESRARLMLAEGVLKAADAGLESLGGQVKSPVAGLVASLAVRPGDTVQAGAVIARVVNDNRLFVEARVAERHAATLKDARGVAIDLPDGNTVTLMDRNVKVLGSGNAIDPQTRTLTVAFEAARNEALLVGMSGPGRVLVGKPREAVVIPRAAVVDDGGVPVAYVLLTGEAFERRVLELGAQMGDRVEVVAGVKAGERVVWRGAYLVRLAEAGTSAAGHGHAH